MNLNDPSTVTIDSVARLLGSKDDSQNRQLRVLENGDVILSDKVGTQSLEGVLFRLETFVAGNGYTGSEAAASTDWVSRIHKALLNNWKDGWRGYQDCF